MKKDLFESLSNIVEKHFWIFLIILACVSIIVPFIIWLCYSVIKIKIETAISADGILEYCGSVISGVLSLFVAGIALYQSKKNRDFEEEKISKQRREQIKPSLQLKIEKTDNSILTLIIQNTTPNNAIGVYLYEYPFLPIIKGNSETNKFFTVDGENPKVINVDKSYCELSEKGYPQNINLIYSDIDNNLISEEYNLIYDDVYCVEKFEYMN